MSTGSYRIGTAEGVNFQSELALRTGTAKPGARLAERILRVPLEIKILGAGMVVGVVALLAVLLAGFSSEPVGVLMLITGLAIAASVALSVLLVRVALRPVQELEQTAHDLLQGNLAARVPQSPIADTGISRVGQAFNMILDSLADERARIRRLTAEVIRTGDRDRARLGHDLHDGAAQTCAALLYEISAMEQRSADPTTTEDLARIRRTIADVIERLRTMARDTHPQVLHDLGLAAALRQLGRQVSNDTGISVIVESEVKRGELQWVIELTAFRIVEEAVRNAVRHAACSVIRINTETDSTRIFLTVSDNGSGFDMDDEELADGPGIFTMTERALLADGHVEISSSNGAGTIVRATLPLRKRDRR